MFLVHLLLCQYVVGFVFRLSALLLVSLLKYRGITDAGAADVAFVE